MAKEGERPLWPSPTGGAAPSAPMAKPPPFGPYGQKRDGHPVWPTSPFGHDGQKSVWPSLPTGGGPFGHEMAKSNPSLAITRLKAGYERTLWPKEAFGQKHGGFGHRMAKRGRERLRWPSHGQKERPTTWPKGATPPHWPPTGQKSPPDRPLATNSPTLTDWGQRVGIV
jgi:hypothetical protein